MSEISFSKYSSRHALDICCAPSGLILLEVFGGDKAIAEMEARLHVI